MKACNIAPCSYRNKIIRYIAIFFFLAFASACTPIMSFAQGAQKVVQGKVLNTAGQPQQGAIVYLKNDKTSDIKSFISIADGSYRFGQLSADIDYELWAELDGKKSSTKTLSSFDSRKNLIYELKLGSGK
jgi:hypothetical protein